jgi:hypothetical protein
VPTPIVEPTTTVEPTTMIELRQPMPSYGQRNLQRE